MRICAFTMAYNEEFFLPIWYEYYGRLLGYENLYLLDHGSDDGSSAFFDNDRRVLLPRGALDEFQRAATVSDFQHRLLSKYDVVIFTDCDEILIPRLEFGDLREFITNSTGPAIRAVGLDLMHFTDVEKELDFRLPILKQRGWVRANPRYSKTLISRVPLRWAPGFHKSDIKAKLNTDIFLLHLKRMDANVLLQTQRRLNSIAWSVASLSAGHGSQFRIPAEDYVQTAFRIKHKNIKNIPTPPFDQAPIDQLMEKGKLLSIPEAYQTAIPVVSLPEGQTVEFLYRDQRVKFYIQNDLDHIQSIHRSGHFYEAEELLIIQSELSENDVFLDIGANIGNHAIFVGLMTKVRKIIAFEPNPPAIAVLKRNIQINHLEHKIDVSCLGIGLGERMEMASTRFTDKNWGGARMNSAPGQDRPSIPVVTGDVLLAKEDVNFIKIDVEGMEMRVLDGLRRTIARHRPKIFIEVDQENTEAFHQWCKDNAYTVTQRFRRYKTNENFLIVPKRQATGDSLM